MEFMPQPSEVMHVTDTPPAAAQVVEEEVASVHIGDQHLQQAHIPSPSLPPQPPQENPIYFSDGVLYPSELNPPITSGESQNTDQTVALPDNLLEIYDNLGLIGKLLTGGSLVTIKFIQAFRTFGESLVNMLGIDSPKYQYEINLAKEMQEQEQQRQQKLDQLYSTWQQPGPSGLSPPMPGPSMFADTSAAVNMQSNIVSMEGCAPVQFAPPVPPMMPPMQQLTPTQLPNPPTGTSFIPAPHIPTMQPPQVTLPCQSPPPGPLMPPMTSTPPQ